MSHMDGETAEIRFGPDGLIPAVIQDAETEAVLMVGFMNAEALQRTRETGRTHFWSRSRAKLWRKGETSGHEQIVDEIFVNCEFNSLLIIVRQIGAACHTGYPTCYYRRLESGDSLTIVKDRWFDPNDVYETVDSESLESRSRRWYGAYEFLRAHDLSQVSGTSRRLRDAESNLHGRVADELRELAGVLTGEHRHQGLEDDAALEGSQCLYWLALIAVRAGITWDALRPDRALITADESLPASSAAKLLLGEAGSWAAGEPNRSAIASRCHAAMAIVAQACRAAHVMPVTLLRRDLDELQTRDYLSPYFSAITP
jgi:phosphoribosyl-AMP cyclohydrolase